MIIQQYKNGHIDKTRTGYDYVTKTTRRSYSSIKALVAGENAPAKKESTSAKAEPKVDQALDPK